MHEIRHWPALMRRDGGIGEFAAQGCERINQLLKFDVARHLGRGDPALTLMTRMENRNSHATTESPPELIRCETGDSKRPKQQTAAAAGGAPDNAAKKPKTSRYSDIMR